MILKRTITLTLCLTGSTLLVILLNLFAGWKYNHPNGFYRKIISHSIKGMGFLKLADNHWYLAGIDSDYAYLGNLFRRNKILRINLKSKDTTAIIITASDTLRFDQGAYLRVENNLISLFDGNKGILLQTPITDGHLSQVQRTSYFTAAIPITPNSVALRIAVERKHNTLEITDKGKLTALYTLEQQVEGLFSTDGMLVKGEGSDKLFYVYYYRNEFLCFNDSLKLLHKGRTIDTNTQAKIRVEPIKSTHELTLATPPVNVNKLSAANGEWLFIASGLVADNEIKATMKDSYAIDVYSAKNGKYKSSFYLPNFDGEKLKDFRVYKKLFVGIFDHYFYIYQLNF